jgi:acetoin utilization protein AcuB
MKTPITRETMSKDLITISWNESIESAYRRMRDFHIRHLPVFDDSTHVVGMLSDRDVQRAMRSEIRHQSAFGDETVTFDPESKVRDYMSWPALTVDSETDLVVLAQRMLAEKLSSILVTRNNSVVGLVTTDDLLRVLVDLLRTPIPAQKLSLMDLVEQSLPRMRSAAV